MAILCALTHNHPLVVDACPGHHPQPIGRNRVFEIERPELPLIGYKLSFYYVMYNHKVTVRLLFRCLVYYQCKYIIKSH